MTFYFGIFRELLVEQTLFSICGVDKSLCYSLALLNLYSLSGLSFQPLATEKQLVFGHHFST